MSDVVRGALASVVEGRTLSMDEARAAMGAVMDGEATAAQLAAFLVALRMRGETIDVVGTGGDSSGTFNISTTSALVVASAGIPVAKHGNRAMTSRSGSADVLDALGVRIDHDAASAGAALAAHGFAFMFAPSFHPAMRHAGPTRREIGVRTAFNLVGPLTNPASVKRLVLGVADPALAPRVAAVLHRLGTERAFVVHGAGVDELPLDGSGVIHEVDLAGVREIQVDPVALGLAPAATSELAGGTPEENAGLVEGVLTGDRGPRRDVVLLNAAAGLTVAGRTATLAEGIALARATIDAGAPGRLLASLRAERITHDRGVAAAAAEGAPA